VPSAGDKSPTTNLFSEEKKQRMTTEMTTNNWLQTRITAERYMDGEKYEAEEGHGIDRVEKAAWVADILPAVTFAKGCQVLDVGCGTGVFSRLLLEWGCELVGLDASEPMLQEAEKRLPPQFQDNARFVAGDTHQPETFSPLRFDWITARQVVGHFYDPLLVFQNWHRWLKPEGRILILEGLWFRKGWGDDELVDLLPLSCHQTRAAVAYLLEKSGFQIEVNQWLANVNDYFVDTGRSDSPRYMLVARKLEKVKENVC
jgi:ubiquinone/menaquinone biosynthesis C-methylase UbiE